MGGDTEKELTVESGDGNNGNKGADDKKVELIVTIDQENNLDDDQSEASDSITKTEIRIQSITFNNANEAPDKDTLKTIAKSISDKSYGEQPTFISVAGQEIRNTANGKPFGEALVDEINEGIEEGEAQAEKYVCLDTISYPVFTKKNTREAAGYLLGKDPAYTNLSIAVKRKYLPCFEVKESGIENHRNTYGIANKGGCYAVLEATSEDGKTITFGIAGFHLDSHSSETRKEEIKALFSHLLDTDIFVIGGDSNYRLDNFDSKNDADAIKSYENDNPTNEIQQKVQDWIHEHDPLSNGKTLFSEYGIIFLPPNDLTYVEHKDNAIKRKANRGGEPSIGSFDISSISINQFIDIKKQHSISIEMKQSKVLKAGNSDHRPTSTEAAVTIYGFELSERQESESKIAPLPQRQTSESPLPFSVTGMLQEAFGMIGQMSNGFGGGPGT
ncbi:hypothetical protein L3V86_04105 [Thiotrichales bacterium 19S11-10]|nr:hypothetical protein [Thiotrichales bacterium 19S11-10]